MDYIQYEIKKIKKELEYFGFHFFNPFKKHQQIIIGYYEWECPCLEKIGKGFHFLFFGFAWIPKKI